MGPLKVDVLSRVFLSLALTEIYAQLCDVRSFICVFDTFLSQMIQREGGC